MYFCVTQNRWWFIFFDHKDYLCHLTLILNSNIILKFHVDVDWVEWARKAIMQHKLYKAVLNFLYQGSALKLVLQHTILKIHTNWAPLFHQIFPKFSVLLTVRPGSKSSLCIARGPLSLLTQKRGPLSLKNHAPIICYGVKCKNPLSI